MSDDERQSPRFHPLLFLAWVVWAWVTWPAQYVARKVREVTGDE